MNYLAINSNNYFLILYFIPFKYKSTVKYLDRIPFSLFFLSISKQEEQIARSNVFKNSFPHSKHTCFVEDIMNKTP